MADLPFSAAVQPQNQPVLSTSTENHTSFPSSPPCSTLESGPNEVQPEESTENDKTVPDKSVNVDEFGLPIAAAGSISKPVAAATGDGESATRRRRRVYDYGSDDEKENSSSNPTVPSITTSDHPHTTTTTTTTEKAKADPATTTISTQSHLFLAGRLKNVASPTNTKKDAFDGLDWQEMPAYATYDIYDDDGRLIARQKNNLTDDEAAGNSDSDVSLAGRGKSVGDGKDKETKEEQDQDARRLEKAKKGRFGDGVGMDYSAFTSAGHGYSRLGGLRGCGDDDDDGETKSVSSLDEKTAYLFEPTPTRPDDGAEPTDEQDDGDSDGLGFDYQDGYGNDVDDLRDEASQLAITKSLLSDRERIGYVGLVRVTAAETEAAVGRLTGRSTALLIPTTILGPKPTTSRKTKTQSKAKPDKAVLRAVDGMAMWRQAVAMRVYQHMDVTDQEQIMVEQLFDHGVGGADLVSSLRPSEDGDDCDDDKTTAETDEAGGKPERDLRWALICDLLLLLLSDGTYDSRSRELLFRVGFHLGLAANEINRFESKVAMTLELAREADADVVHADVSDHITTRRRQARNRRLAMMGLATLGGGLVIGLSAGLLAPMIGAGLVAGFTTIGVAGTGGFLAGAGGAAVVTTGGVVVGSTVGMRAADRRTDAVKAFKLLPVADSRRLGVVVGVSGWMTNRKDDVRLPFSTMVPNQDVYALEWEPDVLTSMGATITILATEAFTQGLQQILGSTVLISLMAAVQVPILLTKLAYLIDNPWAVSQARADAAGKILADLLLARGMGRRPVTLVGYSLGARLVYSCLLELAKRADGDGSQPGSDGLGIVHDVYLFGAPVVVKRDEWRRVRAVVSGRFVNGYATSDWILGYLFRATGGGVLPVAGLGGVNLDGEGGNVVAVDVMEKAMRQQAAVDAEKAGKSKGKKGVEKGETSVEKGETSVEADSTDIKTETDKDDEKKDGPEDEEPKVHVRYSTSALIENIDCSDLVAGHMAYRAAMPKLLRRAGFAVTSDEFVDLNITDDKKTKSKDGSIKSQPEMNENESAAKSGAMISQSNQVGSVSERERERLDQLHCRVERASRQSVPGSTSRGSSKSSRSTSIFQSSKGKKPSGGLWSLFRKETKSRSTTDDDYDIDAEEAVNPTSANQSRMGSEMGDGLYDPDVLFDLDAIAAEAAAVARGYDSDKPTDDRSGPVTPLPVVPTPQEPSPRSSPSTHRRSRESSPGDSIRYTYDIEPDNVWTDDQAQPQPVASWSESDDLAEFAETEVQMTFA